MKKIDYSKKTFRKNLGLFSCPKCKMGFEFYDAGAIRCENNHCFDFSSKGYINFFLGENNEHYDKKSFLKRRNLYDMGFFRPLIENVALIIKETSCRENCVIMDAGCGEGSLISNVIDRVSKNTVCKNTVCKNTVNEYTGIAMDISKDGVGLATDFFPKEPQTEKNIIAIVGDLANMPIKTGAIDFIINVLAPANYGEFERTLATGGKIIKISPGDNYLKEMRDFFYKDTDIENYSGERVTEHFQSKFHLEKTMNINYTFPVDRNIWLEIINMTPLSWNINLELLEEFLAMDLKEVTLDFNINCGKVFTKG